MTTIAKDNRVVTLINVFTVEPARQQQLIDLLVRVTEVTMRKLPGFVSANIHKSVDGTRVVNYAQWRSREDYEMMLRNPAATTHMREAVTVGQPNPHLYEVAEVIPRQAD